ncbi:DUF6431 domain-containing protein [Syntrophomonas wolfei]
MISYEAGEPVYYHVNVLRVICAFCRHIHAILPEIIISYGSYSILFI